MLTLEAARALVDLGSRLPNRERAEEQLRGAVALHNVIEAHGFAYLADEVGMGKTYVALAALALFRNQWPGFHFMVIAPKENIQRKWLKEQRNFLNNNLRYDDLRNTMPSKRPTRRNVVCENLIHLAREASLDPRADFYARMSSFSLAVDDARIQTTREEIERALPWVDFSEFRGKLGEDRQRRFKDYVAAAVNCTLPCIDLLIVDEAHNLKHGVETGAARNRLLNIAFGYSSDGEIKDRFPGYAPRVKRLLLLSATPIEDDFRHLTNQLKVFGREAGFETLESREASEDEKKAVARKFLIRRVTTSGIGQFTKNQYRREWRRGGLDKHDFPMRMEDFKGKLAIALVQKKVAEILGDERFGNRFQIGMLASFESFSETSGIKIDGEEVRFDDSEQSKDQEERRGVDTDAIDRIARSHYREFGQELPHPKLDALVEKLRDSWVLGRKSLVFVRRVASVKDIKARLEHRYDDWLRERLSAGAERHREELERQFSEYRKIKKDSRPSIDEADDPKGADSGSTHTFFAHFFRGEGPMGVFSGATLQRQFQSGSGTFGCFFSRNFVAEILGTPPSGVMDALIAFTGRTAEHLLADIGERAKGFLTDIETTAFQEQFEAVQCGALSLMAELPAFPKAKIAVNLWARQRRTARHARKGIPRVLEKLSLDTFWSSLLREEELRVRLWPQSILDDPERAFIDEQARADLLSSAARLGHAFIDLYLLVIGRRPNLRVGRAISETVDLGDDIISSYIRMLKEQSTKTAEFQAYHELREIAENFGLIRDVNLPELRDPSFDLAEAPRIFGRLLGRQRPIAGMAGQINAAVVRQFRMPGYPFVLVTTDLLQEGEDLHTFCSDIHHYGVAWTPSACEQRVGRIDRLQSQTDRRLATRRDAPDGAEKLQVYFPHLEDTVEVLQIRRVLGRLNDFMRLMHHGLGFSKERDSMTEVDMEAHRDENYLREVYSPIEGHLETAFAPTEKQVNPRGALAVLPTDKKAAATMEARLDNIRASLPSLASSLDLEWMDGCKPGMLAGRVRFDDRIQDFSLFFRLFNDELILHCVSPVGRIREGDLRDCVRWDAGKFTLANVEKTDDVRFYNLASEAGILLTEEIHDSKRACWLVERVARSADQEEQEILRIDRESGFFNDRLLKEAHHVP